MERTYLGEILFLFLDLLSTTSSTAKFRESQASFAATRKHCVRRIGSLLFLAFQLGCDPEVVALTVLYISSFIFV